MRNKLLVVCALARAVLLATVAAADDAPALEAYLSRLGLKELRLYHMEQLLSRENDSRKRAANVQAVVDAYAEELAAAADEPARFAAMQARVEKLLAAMPAARTAALDVVLLQAEYQRAEALMVAWQEDQMAAKRLDEAREILTRIQPLLAAHQAELSAAADKTAETIDNIKSEQARQTAEQQLGRQRTLAARADYFAGWSSYYLGVARQDAKAAEPDFAQAKQHFTRLLDVTDDGDYASIEADGLALDSVWRARAAIGLGLCELGLQRLAAAERVLAWLNQAAVAPSLRDQAKYWHLQGLLNARLWSEAGQFATDEVARFSSSSSAGKTSLCISAVRAGAALAEVELRRLLILPGIRGLARMRQFDTLDKLIDQYKLAEGNLAGDFHLMWLRGRRQYLTAEKAKQPVEFRAAAETLMAALNQPEARRELSEAGQARYYLGWASYRLDEFAAAAQHFREAASTLRSAVPDISAQAAWMHCTCLVKRAEKDSRQGAAAIAALVAFKQEYPASEEATGVDLLVTRLRQSHLPSEQTIRELARIKPDDPSHPSAQFEICQLQHQLWSKSKPDRAKAQPLARELLGAVQRLLGAERAAPDQRLKAVLLAVDVLRGAAPPDWQQIATFLSRATNDAERLDETSASRVEYEYRRLELAQEQGNGEEVQRAADWIAKHGVSTAYELPALIIVARAGDQAIAAASGDERSDKIAEALRIYERLVALLGDSPAALSNNNALAAASKLAQLDEELGRWPAAAERLNRLVVAQPSDRRLLRRAGLACFQAGQYPLALAHWRTLLGGLESGSEAWLEAKYFQVACLEQTDRESAKKVLAQFRVLYPDVKSEVWREKLAKLAINLK